MKRAKILALLLMVAVGARAQQHTISGTVTDRKSGETLIGTTVGDMGRQKGTTTNAYGRYSLTLPDGQVCLRVSAAGYQPVNDTFMLTRDTVINFRLVEGHILSEVVIQGEKPTDAKSSQMSAVSVPIEHIKAVPVLFGEADVIKAIQLMPGVQSGSEGTSGMYVRGGGPDENLFLLDGVPLYNVNHLFGFFSAFNDDAIKSVTLYKGSFPAHFGGRLSSVLDITANDGNDKELHGGVSVGLISAKVYVEGPIIKEKTTFSFSARRTYADALIQPFISILGVSALDTRSAAGYYFYDLNAKVSHKFSDKSRLFLNFYSGDDKVYLKFKTRDTYTATYGEKVYLKMGYNWGNLVGSARWNYVISPKLFMNVTGAYTRYRNDMNFGVEQISNIDASVESLDIDMAYNSGIHDLTGRVDFDFQPNPDHTMKFGAYMVHHIFRPEVLGTTMHNVSQEERFDFDTTMGESTIHANELNAYIEDDWNITASIKLSAGVNLAAFGVSSLGVTGDTIFKIYPSIQPRLSGRMLITDDLSFKAGYAYTTQYLHLLSNSSISMPTDLWVPVTARIAPMNAHQVAAGFFYNWGTICDLSVEAYYKKMNNLMEYKDGASFWGSSTGWEDKVTLGKGWAYGVEFLAQRTVGEVTGWVGYTWSKAERQFEEISGGQVFPAKYDRRHDVSIVLMWKPNEQFDISGTWVYCTGNTATLGTQEFEPLDGYGELTYIEHRNNYRLPAYHRADVSVNFHKQKKRGLRTWNISVYNLYNRHNPYIIYEGYGGYTAPDGTYYTSSLKQRSIFPIIPSVSYQFKF